MKVENWAIKCTKVLAAHQEKILQEQIALESHARLYLEMTTIMDCMISFVRKTQVK